MDLAIRYLEAHEFARFGEIDRSEHIDGQYVVDGGALRLVAVIIEVAGWFPNEVESYVKRLGEVHAAGGEVLGAFDGPALVAVASLDVRPVQTIPTALSLDLLHVSAPYRNRGLGKRLTAELADRARVRGARGLYISATPTRNTVEAYLRMGATLLEKPDPQLFELEPEDIHLLLPLAPAP